MNLTELSIKRPTFVMVIILIMSIFGYISYKNTSYELFPKFDVPLLVINTIYPGASPEEIETQVTKKIEDQISSLENIKIIRSTSYDNLSQIIVELTPKADVDESITDAQRLVSIAVPDLPDNAKAPTIFKVTADGLPILEYGISSNIPSTIELTQFIKDKIVPQLSNVKKVANVSLKGAVEKAIRVNVNANKLREYNLSILQVTQAINLNNLNFPTGSVENNTNNIRVKLTGKYESVEDLQELVVSSSTFGSKVKLKDLAVVIEDKKTPITFSRINGKLSVGIVITKQADANALEMAELVKLKIADLEKSYASKNIKFKKVIDITEFTVSAADDVKHDLTIALLLVSIVILFFLHSLRDSLIVLVSIPVSFLGTLIAIYYMDYSFNLMTLLGLTLVVGILVDDSIVVLENIHRHLHMGKNRVQAALDGRNEIGSTAIAITLVDIIVFFPIAISNGGFVTKFLSPFAWVVIISTLLSLFISFTLTPLLASRYATIIDLDKKTPWFRLNKYIENKITQLSDWYVVKLGWVLRHKRLTIFSIFGLFIASFSLVALGFIGNTFVERGNRGEAIFRIETHKSSSLAFTDSITKVAEAKILALPEVATVLTNVGISEGGFVAGNLPAYRSEIRVVLKKNSGLSDKEFIQKTNPIIASIPDVDLSNTIIDFNSAPGERPIQILVASDNADTVALYSNKLKTMVMSLNGTSKVRSSIDDGVSEVKVAVNKEKMRDLGLNIADVGATMANAFHGDDNSKYYSGGNEFDIIVQLNEFDRKNTDNVSKLTFLNNKGALIELSQFATISSGIGLAKLQRSDKMTSALVDSYLVGRQIGEVGPEIEKKIAEAHFPNTVKVTWIGEYGNQLEGNGILGAAFGISFLLMYFLLVILYGDFVYPLVVLFAIPMSFIGAFFALALAKSSLSLISMMGLIIMMGLATKNSILIVDFANKEKEEGKSSLEALLAAGKERLRPILMTTVAMVLGMLPVAIAQGAGAEWKNGLGWALVGGLTSSMCLTVFIVPAVYLVVDTIKMKLGKGKTNRIAGVIELEQVEV